MKRLFCLTLMAIFLVPLAGAAELKIGYVVIPDIFEGYTAMRTEVDKLQEEYKSSQAELDQRQENLINESKDFENQKGLMTDEKKEAKSVELRNKYQEFQQFATGRDQELSEKRDTQLEGYLETIYQTIEKLAEAEGYDFILRKKNLAFAKESHNVTSKIIELLNK